MSRSLCPKVFRFVQFLLLLLSTPQHANANVHDHDNDPNLFSFNSRPDLKAPRWEVDVKKPELVNAGYWFLAPYEFIKQPEAANGWVGPHIYDGTGELVWSGVGLVNNTNVFDFKRSNVNGKDMLVYESHHQGNGYILDESFEIKQMIDLGVLNEDYNSHEFAFFNDGTRAFSMTEGRREATPEQLMTVEWSPEEKCRAIFNGFKVWDTTTWETIWQWSSFDHIGLNESTFHKVHMCGEPYGWDFVHINSIDVDQNGDYYVSARHADSIYKVSKDDGHIIWKLNGRAEPGGDFDMADVRFRRQHNVRFRGFNGTHEVISILDNGKGEDDEPPSYPNSRGMTIVLDTQSPQMTARYGMTIDHPDGKGAFAFRRGNYQVLDNGHIFMGWSEQAMHSEHTPDGELIMEARLKTHWLGSYRSYKFPLIGRPTEPPVAVSVAHGSPARNSITTLVHVSWNGATEVASWNLYKTTETGEPAIQILSKPKAGFETPLAWDGYASYVFAEALDAQGNVLGRSNIAKTKEPPAEAVGPAVADEEYWLQEMHGQNDASKQPSKQPQKQPSKQSSKQSSAASSNIPSTAFGWSLLIFGVSLVSFMVGFAIARIFFLRSRRQLDNMKAAQYESLLEREKDQDYSEDEGRRG